MTTAMRVCARCGHMHDRAADTCSLTCELLLEASADVPGYHHHRNTTEATQEAGGALQPRRRVLLDNGVDAHSPKDHSVGW